MLADIGAIQALKECASSPDELPAKFASEALTIIGEQVPYKLSQQVPCWSIKDVQYWVEKVRCDGGMDLICSDQGGGGGRKDQLIHFYGRFARVIATNNLLTLDFL